MSSFDRILLAKQNEVQNRKSQSAIAVSAAKLHFRTTQALDTDTAPSETDTNTYGAIANESRRFVADSPIVNQDRDVNKHEDGTYSITTAEGKELVGLDELTARSYSAWNQEDFRAKQAGASDSWGKNTANAIGQTVSNIGVTAASATAGYTTLAEQVGYENYVSKVRQGNKYDPATELTEQDIAKFQSVKDGKGSENAASREFAGTDKFKTMERLSEDAAVNKGQVDNIKKFGEEVKKFIPVNRKEQVAAHTEFKTIAKNEGIWEATKHTMFNNLDVLGQQGIESVPYMIAFTVGGPVTQASILSTLAVGKGQEAIQEFVTKNRREPTAEESTRIKAWSVVATVAEKFGDMAVTRAIPAAQLKWFTKVKDQVTDSIPTSIATLPSVKASQSILTKGVLRPAIALAGEGQSGAITAVSEQLAQDGKITDTSAIAYDALAEAFGTPGGVAAIVTAKTVTRATKGAIEGVSNERNNRSRATELRAELAKPSAFADTPEADEVRNRIAEIDQEIQGNDLTTVAGTATAPINVVELSAERSQLQAQLDTLDEGSITAEERKAAQAEYDALPIRLRPEAKPAPTERKSNTEDKVEDTPEPTEEISPEDFQAALDKIKLTSESSQEDLDALKALRTGYKLTEAQTTARRAKAAEVAALAKKTSDSNAAEEAANEGKPKKGSFDIITVTGHTPEELDAAEAKATKEGKPKDVEHVKTLRTANELEEQLDKVEKDKLVSKTQAAVNTEVLDGTSDRWVGMNTYFSAINEAKAIMNSGGNKAVAAAQAMKSSLSKMTTHVGNIRAKHNALVSALSAASKGKPVFVRGDRVTKGNEASREMKYTRQPDMTEAQFKEARANGEYVFRIDANSKKLVDAIGQEAKYGDAMLKVANGHKDTSYAEAATNKQRADAKLAKDIADLNNDSDNLTDEDITDSDLDAIDAEEKANDSSKDEAPADKTSSTDSDGDTSSEENSVKPTTVDADSAATESVSEQSAEDTIETKEDKPASTSEEASTTEAGEVTSSDIFTDSELGNMDNILGVSEEDIQGYIDNSDSLAKAIDELNNTDVREDGADAQAEVQQELDYLNKIQDYMQNQREAEGERSSAPRPLGGKKADPNAVSTVAVSKILPVFDAAFNFLVEAGDNLVKATVKSGTFFAGQTIVDLVKITKGRSGIFSIPANLFPTDTSDAQAKPFIEALVGIGLSETTAREYALMFVLYNAAYQQLTTTESYVTKTGTAPALRAPQRLLEQFPVDAEGNLIEGSVGVLPPQAVFALMVGVDNFQTNNNSDSQFGTDRDKANFIHGTQRATLSAADLSALQFERNGEMEEIGLDYRFATQDIGPVILGILGMSATNADTSAYVEALGVSLGALSLEVLNKRADIPGNMFAQLEIITHKWDFGLTRNPETGVINEADSRNFVQGEEYNHIKYVNPPSQENRKENVAKNDVAVKLLSNGVETETGDTPLQDPPKTVTSEIRNSFGGVPEKMRDIIDKMQKVVWGESDTLPTIVALAVNHTELLHTLMNFGKFDKYDVEAHAASVKASNDDKIKALKGVLEQQKMGHLKKFYYRYKLMNQHRMMQTGNVNAQSSHFTRHMVNPQGTTKFTSENIHMFKYAVMFNLGYKVDKNVPTDITKAFDEYLKDPDLAKAVQLLQAETLNEDALAEVVLQLKTKTDSVFANTDISLLTGLIGLAKYRPHHAAQVQYDAALQEAKANGTEAPKAPKYLFESGIPLEIDGVSNGFAINVFQFPKFDSLFALEKHLNQTGTYLGKTDAETTHLESGIHDPESAVSQHYNGEPATDSYLDLGALVQRAKGLAQAITYYTDKNASAKFLNYVESTYEGKSAALDQLYPDLADEKARDLVKYPFMIFLYGGGIQSISEGVAKQVIAYLYESMGTLRRDYAKDPSEANEKAINDFTAHLATLNLDNAGALNTALKTGTRLKNFSINEDQLISDIGRTLEPRFDSGLNAMLGDTKKLRDGVTQSAEIMHAVFMYHYNKAVTAEKVRLKRPETGELTNAETLALIKKSVKQWLPQYKGPLMSANETSFVDLSKRISTRTSSTANRVTTTVRNFTKTARNPGDTRDRVNEPKNKEFTSPSVSALIRGIINMDATLLALSLDGNPNVLALYDAVFGRPEDLMAISETYNDNYMKYGMETSVADIMRNRVEYVLNQTASTAGALDEISADLEETAHVNQFPDEDGPKNLQKLRDSVNEAADDTVESRAVLAELIKERGARTWQLFAAAMAATNLGAGQSVDSRVGELRSGLNSHINKIVMSLVDRMSPAVKSRYTSLMSEGVPRALEVLQAYTPEHAKAYINIAQDRTVIKNALDVIKSEFKGESFKAEEVLVNLLQDSADHQTRNEQLAGKIDTAAIEAELSLYAVPTDFSIESDTATAAERAIVDEYNSLDNLRRDNEKTVFAKDITESSINALFNKFTSLSRHYYSSKEAADKHTEGLQRVMSKLSKGIGALGRIRIQVEKIDGITQGNYDATRKRVRVSLSRQVPGARNEYSPQEVYVHEVLHAMTVTAINSNKLIGDRIRKVRAQAKNNIDKKGGYKTFLTHITGTPTQDEVDLAKHQYNYLFGKEALNVPEEFLAYAVTNPTVMGVLESFDTALPDRGDGLVAKIQQIIDMVLEQFARVMGRKVNANAYEEMLAITEQLIEIQSGHQSKLDILETKTSAFMNKADKAFKSAVLDTVSTVMAKDDNGLGIRTLAQAAIGGAVMALGTGAAANTVTLAAYTSVGGVLESALKEMGEGVLTKPLVKALLHTKANISKLHQQVEMDAVRRLDASWKSTTPDAIKFTTRKAITRVLYRTDLSSLITDRPGGMTHAEVSKILSNPDMIKAEKKRILKAANIRSGKAIKHAQELGYFIATKRSYLSQGHFNVHSIAGQYLNSEDITPQNIDALNAIATLTALQHQKEGDLKLVSELMSAEIEADPTENGLQYMLDSHRAHVGQSLTNLFHGNPIQMQKGYTVERIDNLTDMRTGVNTKEEAKLMAREGYNEPYDMGDIPGVKQAHTVMYISRTTPEIRHVSGILSTTGLHHSGTLLSEVIGKDPKFQDKDKQPDRKKIRAEVAKLHRRESGLEKKGERDYDQRLRPIRDENNKIVDYRIIMNSDSVEKLFQPDMEFQDVFAHMNSSYVNKKNTVSADKDTVDILVNEWVGLQPSIPDQFINIMDPESKYFERYLKMPEEVRKYMQQYTVNGEFMVRENIIDKVFGYPAKDMSRSPLLQGASMGIARNVARKFNYGLRQVMAFGMERIVMATLMVITKNIESNIYHLGLRKIGPRFIANKMQEGLQAYERYETDTRKLRDLYHEIQMATGAAKTALQRELAAVEIEVENNAIHKISSAGLQNLIVEDVNTSSGEGYMRRMHNMLQTESIVSITDKMPTTLTEFAKNLVLARSSYIYRKHKQSVQLTDFLGRYVMIQHAVEVEGRPFDEVLHESIDAFVLFDENMHPWLEAINSMGFTAFLSYFLRNTRAARQSIQKSPVSVMTAGGIQATLDIDAMAHINSSIFLGKMLPNSLYQDELLDAATTIHGIENFTDVLGLLD